MPERDARGPGQAGVALLHVAALWALATTWALPALLLLALPCLLSLRFQLALPVPWLRALARLGALLAALVLLLSLGFVLYALLPEPTIERLGQAGGLTLAVLGTVLVLAARSLPAGRGALPASLGALVSAALRPQAALAAPLALAAAAVVLLLGAGAPRRGWLRPALSVLLATGVALGLARLLPWLQPQAEQAIAAAMETRARGLVGFSTRSTLGDVQGLGQSDRLALRLYAPSALKLRGLVLTRFDGRAWSAAADPAPAAAALGPQSLAGEWPAGQAGAWYLRPGAEPAGLPGDGPALTVVSALSEPALFLPEATLAVRAVPARLVWSPFGTLRASPALDHYDVRLRAGAVPAAPCPDCLALPPRIDPRLLDLARRLASEADTPERRVERTLAHLGATCRYSLEPGAFRGADPLAEFLFEKRRGYCEYFASSAALLLRLQGVPTRYVKGFNVIEERRAGDHYRVREADAHAWIDVLLPGAGWREVDPTPAADYAALHGERDGRLAAAWERLVAWLALQRVRLSSGALDWRALLALLGATLTAFVLVRFLRRGRRRRAPAAAPGPDAPALRPELRAALRRLDALCARAGAERPPARGLLEHLGGLPAERFPAEWRRAGRELAEAVYGEVYGGRPAADARLSDLLGELARLSAPAAPRS